ncbi:MAG: tRNA (N(6)-L-threonylcarbamoyladenosine(37)-C(2))-methylthiotransferase MtaB [Anaerolineaceae bacterium]|nr:tRNA (N(6)-L-threonylcarbamoyladenosine(37)-C(2))-methylthiotransferase MtaB [Anaerolineaceae bacterium]
MRVHLRMLGCRLNQSEIDMMARQFQAQGHDIVDDPALADQVVVNTCAVTQDAVRSSRKLVRDLHTINADAAITVTGCYAQIAPEDIAILPGVAGVVDNLAKDSLVETLTGQPVLPFEQEPLERGVHPGASGRTRAFIKVQDGCDNACTFCITTVARGAGRSRSQDEIVAEIRYLHSIGYQEAVLTGVHLGSYGHDRSDPDGLAGLVRAILAETDIPRLRLSSLEPWDLAPSFFDLWDNPRLCRHLHLPLQSGSDATLKRMLRRTTQVQFRALVEAARARIPGVSITTDVIVGFPGETDAEFAESAAFIAEMDFAGLHVFRYSRRPGTAAARMRGHIPKDVQKTRSAHLLALASDMENRFAAQFAGETLPVLWEQIAGVQEEGFLNVGYTDNYIRVRCVHPRPLTNHILPAQVAGYDLATGQTQVTVHVKDLSPDQYGA